MDDLKRREVAAGQAAGCDVFLPDGDNTKFIVEEGLPLLNAYRRIENPDVRQSVFEFVQKIADAEG